MGGKTKTFKEYYQDPEFREKHRNYMATKVACDCGAVTARNNMHRHKQTNKHKRLMGQKDKENEYDEMKKEIKKLNKLLANFSN